MFKSINNEKDLGEALKKDEETIIIEGDLKNKVIKIHAVGNVAWVIAIGAIGIAVASIIATPATGGLSNMTHAFTAPAAISILGAATTKTAIGIAVAAGGVGSLNKLRGYKIIEKDNNRVMLRKK